MDSTLWWCVPCDMKVATASYLILLSPLLAALILIGYLIFKKCHRTMNRVDFDDTDIHIGDDTVGNTGKTWRISIKWTGRSVNMRFDENVFSLQIKSAVKCDTRLKTRQYGRWPLPYWTNRNFKKDKFLSTVSLD